MSGQLPPGYQRHPNNPNYIWNPSTNDVRAMPMEQPPPPVMPPAQAPVQVSMPEQTWGQQDLDQAAQDLATGKARSDFSSDGNFIYVGFPRQANEEIILSRFLPPWGRTERKAYIESFRHRLYARLIPDPPTNRDFISFDCFDNPGGPGNCDICAALEVILNNSSATGVDDFHGMAKRKPSAVWQMLNLQDPAKHYQTIKDAQGQEAQGIVPGLFRVGPQLHNAILACFRNGDFTHHQIGFPIECIRNKTGGGTFDVEYKANHMAHHAGPIDPSLVSVLYNLVNLRDKAIIFHKREKFQAIAQNIISFYGGGNRGQVQVPAQVGQWIPHPQSPGWEYHSVTRQVRQIQAAPPPVAALPAPPVAQLPAYAPPAQMASPPPVQASYAPPIPGQAPPPPVAPPAAVAPPVGGNQPPPPPPAAPGLAASGQFPAMPPVAPPGMPPSVPAQPPSAPVPMSPDQLQGQFAPPVGGVATGGNAAPLVPPVAPGNPGDPPF